MIILRKEVKQPFIIRLVATLERIQQHKAPTWLQNAGAFAKDDAAHLWWQFVKHENARHRVVTSVRRRDRLCVADNEVDPRPPPQLMLGVPDVRLRQIKAQ